MEKQTTNLYLQNVSGATVSVSGGIMKLAGYNNTPIRTSCIDSCGVECERVAVKKVVRVTFAAVDFGDCNDCGKVLDLRFRIERNGIADVETSIGNNTPIPISLPSSVSLTGNVAANIIAAGFAAVINDPNNIVDYFGAVAVATGANLDITFPENHDVTVLEYTNENVLSTERPTITVTTPVTFSNLGYPERLTRFPLLSGDYVPGLPPQNFFSECKKLCIVYLFQSFENGANCDVEMPISRDTRAYALFVDSSNTTNYNAFIAALKAAVTACNVGIP